MTEKYRCVECAKLHDNTCPIAEEERPWDFTEPETCYDHYPLKAQIAWELHCEGVTDPEEIQRAMDDADAAIAHMIGG